MRKRNHYNDNNVKTKLLKKRADDYARMVKTIDAIGEDVEITCSEFNFLCEGHEKEYVTFSTLRNNSVLVESSSKWVDSGYRRSFWQDGSFRRNIRFYDDGAGHAISEKQYNTLCEVYGEKYVKTVLNFEFLEYRTYSPGHYEGVYRIDKTNANKIRSLAQSFNAICEEVL